jgi:hypothetical protein
LSLSGPAFGQEQTSDAVVELLTLPRGDAERGREAFVELKCFSCHAVPGDVSMPGPVAMKPAPALGVKQSNYKTGFITESVIFPAHDVAPGGKDPATSASRMGDFSDIMTVRQLTDLVAYLKSLDEEI